MRFNSDEHLDNWVKNKTYPVIHKNIFEVFATFNNSKCVLDLCCSHGLLGTQIKERLKIEVIGIDNDKTAVQKAQKAGIPFPINLMKVKPATINDLQATFQEWGVDTIIARRAIPELFGENLDFGKTFVNLLKKMNIKQVFLEGRQATKNATNIFSSIEDEVKLFEEHYQLKQLYKNVAYLGLK